MSSFPDQRLIDLNNRLIVAIKDNRQKEKLVFALASNREELTQTEEALKASRHALEKEAIDVSNLEKVSLTSLYFQLIGMRKKRLTKERREVEKAQLIYSQTQSHLGYLREDRRKLTKALDEFILTDITLNGIIEEKKKLLVSINHPEIRKIQAITENIERFRLNSAEIYQAQQAGLQFNQSLNLVIKSLQVAKSWGQRDLWGGGSLSSFQKREAIKKAIRASEVLKVKTAVFNRELKDIYQLGANFQIYVTEDSRFVDIYFDNFFTDLTIQREIDRSLISLKNTFKHFKGIMFDLENMRKSTENQIPLLERQIHTLIEEAG